MAGDPEESVPGVSDVVGRRRARLGRGVGVAAPQRLAARRLAPAARRTAFNTHASRCRQKVCVLRVWRETVPWYERYGSNNNCAGF